MFVENDIDAELQRLKETILSPTEPLSLPFYQEALDLGIVSLRESINLLQATCSDLRNRCQLSISKASASHEKAQAALLEQDMASVFQHSIDKAVHIRLAQAFKIRVEQLEATIEPLKQRLANLENLLKH